MIIRILGNMRGGGKGFRLKVFIHLKEEEGFVWVPTWFGESGGG